MTGSGCGSLKEFVVIIIQPDSQIMIPARIIVFGSSTVYGRGDPERGGFVGRLRGWHEPKHSSNLVYNLGVPGDSVQGMLSRMEAEVSFRRPDLILLYPGLNDTRRTGSRGAPTAISGEQFHAQLSALLDKSKKLAPTLMISSFPVDETRTTPWQNSGRHEIFYLAEDARLFTDIGRSLCEERKISYMPIFETWSKGTDCRALSIDGLHGSPEAHAKLFEELKIFLCGMFEE